MEIVSTFQERLKEALSNQSVTAFASSIGVSKQSISAYLTGTRKPKRFVIEAIARELNVNPAWLCGYDAPKLPPIDPSAQLSPVEAALVSDFRQLSPEGQEYILQTMAMARRSYSGKNDTTSDLEKAL